MFLFFLFRNSFAFFCLYCFLRLCETVLIIIVNARIIIKLVSDRLRLLFKESSDSNRRAYYSRQSRRNRNPNFSFFLHIRHPFLFLFLL